MHELWTALGENSDAIHALGALISIVLLVPSAGFFLANQRAQLMEAREAGHRYVIEKYREFLNLCLANPRLSLETGEPQSDLSESERLQRDILFDLLTATFERAFIAYADARRSYRATQWRGWESYIGDYVSRSDYLEWWRRVMFLGDPARFFEQGASQYDRRFERYMYARLRKALLERHEGGELDAFGPHA